jgi:hypothetical protein
MLNLKKTALAVIALGSTAAFAGTMGPVCSAVNVTVPCETCAWDVGGRALYLQSGANTGTQSFTLTQGNNRYNGGVSPQWGWGFQLEASYHYSTGNDMNLNWYHYRNTTTNAYGGPALAFNRPNNQAFSVTTASSSVNPQWDQVNIEFGQHVDFGENKFARVHGGFNFSRTGIAGTGVFNGIDQTINPTDPFRVTTTKNYAATYNGFGPRVGMDLNYEWGNGVGVYADGALSVLAGSSKSSVITSDALLPARNNAYSSSQSKVVGELDAKVGMMYTYAMAQGDLSLDVGWVWAHYTNPTTELYDFNTGNQNGFEEAFGIQGLYFGAKWVGNVA